MCFQMPPGYSGELVIRLTNDGYDGNVPLDFCNLGAIDVGTNLPCVNLVNDTLLNVTQENKTLADG